MRGSRLSIVGFIVFAGAVASARGETREQHSHGDLGSVEFPTSCSREAQREFTRGVALLHHMTYPQARAAFERAQAVDPSCAMARWGVVMTLFQPLWPTRPSADALRGGWGVLEGARTLNASPRERLFLEAAEAFFADPDSSDYWLRIRRWEQAMTKVHAALPDDAEAAAFYALAHLATAPVSSISREHADRAAGILQRVYDRNPNHPGAMHYLVHANDVPGRERELLEVTRKYESVAPRNPHALHMPTHIYTRLGDWESVIRGNLLAAEAALAHPAGERGEFVWDEFPHAIEYLVYAYLQQGDDDAAAAQIARLRAVRNLEPSFKTAFHLASTSARYALERHAWKEALALTPREPSGLAWDRFTWPEAAVWFARGLGAVRSGQLDEASASLARLQQLEDATRKLGEELFVRNIAMFRLELSAWLAHARGDAAASVTHMQEAAALEASTPKHAVTPGPTLPAEEQLGDLLLVQQEPARALEAYRRALALYPRRLNSLLGAARAARALGDPSARHYYTEVAQTARTASRPGVKEEADTFLRGSRGR